MKIQSSSKAGFTLIEMLVTITIIVILAGLSLGGFKFVTTKQANSQAAIQIKLLESAIEEYKLDHGEYPKVTTGTTDISILYQKLYKDGVDNPNDNKIYLSDLDPRNNKQGWNTESNPSQLTDPWGAQYIYRNPGTLNPDFDLVSKGQDGTEGTPDDHRN